MHEIGSTTVGLYNNASADGAQKINQPYGLMSSFMTPMNITRMPSIKDKYKLLCTQNSCNERCMLGFGMYSPSCCFKVQPNNLAIIRYSWCFRHVALDWRQGGKKIYWFDFKKTQMLFLFKVISGKSCNHDAIAEYLEDVHIFTFYFFSCNLFVTFIVSTATSLSNIVLIGMQDIND